MSECILYRISPTEFLVHDKWDAGGTSYRIIVLREDKRRRALMIEGSWFKNMDITYILNLNPHRSEIHTISRKSVANLPWETIE